MSRHHLRFVVASTAVIGLFAASCGSDDDSGGSAADTAAPADSTSDSSAPAESAAPADTAAAGAEAPATPDDSNWDAVLTAANEESKATLYSVVVPEINERLEAAFEAEYPDIDLEVIRTVGGDIDANLEAERATGAAGGDIVLHVNYPWAVGAQADGVLVAPVGPIATSDAWAGTDFFIDGTTQVSTFTMIGLGYNTDALDAGPTSFEDLLSPEYAGGKIGLPDPAAPVVADFYATLQDLMGEDFLEKLAAQDPVFFESVVPIQQALAAGEIDVAGYATLPGIKGLASEGAPVEFVLPEGAWASPIWTYVPEWVEHPNAAQVVYEFLSSPEGQAALGQDSISSQPDVPGTFASVDSVTVANVDRIVDPEWFDPYYAEWNATFGR